MSEQRDCSETGYFSGCLHVWNEYSAFGMHSRYGLCSIGISVESPLRSKAKNYWSSDYAEANKVAESTVAVKRARVAEIMREFDDRFGIRFDVGLYIPSGSVTRSLCWSTASFSDCS